MAYGWYPRYVTVAEKKARAAQKVKKLRKKIPAIQPVILPGKALATSWWGKAWNKNLERYADYSNRIGRGRSYVRHGAVLDLHIEPGVITALVDGSFAEPYEVAITIAKLPKKNWQKIQQQASSQLSSLPDLLAGKFPKSLQDIFMAKGQGLFPSPKEIKLNCDCPDWATMCKHVAATLYGVGARLDADPSLFFTLRQVAIDELVSQAVASKTDSILNENRATGHKVIADNSLGELFGISMDEKIDFTTPTGKKPKENVTKKTAKVPRPHTAKREEKRSASRKLADLLVAIIDEYGEEISVGELADISGQPAKRLYPLLSRLHKQGFIARADRGLYSPI